jgi:hypothetical protein
MTNAYSLFLEAIALNNNPAYYRQPHPFWCVETCYRFLRGLPAKRDLFLSPANSRGVGAFGAKLLGAAYGLLLIEEADYNDDWSEDVVYMHFSYLSGSQHSTLITYTEDIQLALTVYDPATGAISRKAASQVRIDRLYRIYAAPQMADIC